MLIGSKDFRQLLQVLFLGTEVVFHLPYIQETILFLLLDYLAYNNQGIFTENLVDEVNVFHFVGGAQTFSIMQYNLSES